MARALLVLIALLGLCASLVPIVTLLIFAWPGWSPSLAELHAAPDLRAALVIAGAISALSLPIGFGVASVMGRARHWSRVVALGLCVVILMNQGAALSADALHHPTLVRNLFGFTAAVCRATSVVILLLSACTARIPANLLRAARVAGARPFQAWRHAVLQPLAWPLLAAFVAAFLVGLAKGPLSSPLLHKLAIFRTWDVSAGLLLAIVSLSALGALPRRRPA